MLKYLCSMKAGPPRGRATCLRPLTYLPPPKKNPEIEQGPKSGRVLSINGPFSGIFNALEYCLPVLVVLWLFILP